MFRAAIIIVNIAFAQQFNVLGYMEASVTCHYFGFTIFIFNLPRIIVNIHCTNQLWVVDHKVISFLAVNLIMMRDQICNKIITNQLSRKRDERVVAIAILQIYK